MQSKFIKKVTSEGKRKVINVPKNNPINVGDNVLVQRIDIEEIDKLTSNKELSLEMKIKEIEKSMKNEKKINGETYEKAKAEVLKELLMEIKKEREKTND